jgi:hypothetical protein
MERVSTGVVDVSRPEPRLTESLETLGPSALSRGNLHTVTMHLPLLHNPNYLGIRMPVWFGKFWRTVGELKCQFSGFNVSACLGWCNGDGIWDPHLCIEFDVEITPEVECYLVWWRGVLKDRFKQRSFYMKSFGPVRWI